MDVPGYELPPELRSLRSKVRDLMQDEIVPLERDLDPEAIDLPDDLRTALAAKVRDAGLWALGAPTEMGGGGLGPFDQVVLLEEMAQHRNGLYNPGYGVFGRYPPSVCWHCSPEQAERFVIPAIRDGVKTFFAMSEPSASDPRGGANPAGGIATTAVRDGDNWVINGTKTWISHGDDGRWGVVFARTGDEPGRDLSCFFVERHQFEARPIPVIRPDYPADLVLHDCVVPHENLLGEEGGARPMASAMLIGNRISFAAAHVGVAVAALRLAADRCRDVESPLEWTLADADLEIRSARWLLWEAAWQAGRGDDIRVPASIAKLASSETLVRVVDRAIQIYGGYGVTKELPFERWWREARGRLVAAGPSESLRREIARALVAR